MCLLALELVGKPIEDALCLTRNSVSHRLDLVERNATVAVRVKALLDLVSRGSRRLGSLHDALSQGVKHFLGLDLAVTVSVERRSYTYDRHGNWTSCRYSLDGKEIYTIERKIEYYGE